MTAFSIGEEIMVVSGTYIGTIGTITGSTTKMVYVELTKELKKVRIMKSSVELLSSEKHACNNKTRSFLQNLNMSSSRPIRNVVPNNAADVVVSGTKVKHDHCSSDLGSVPCEMRPNSNDLVTSCGTIGGFRIESIRLALRKKELCSDRTFAAHFFKDRLLALELILGSPKSLIKSKIPTRIEHNGSEYDLLCSKLQKVSNGAMSCTKSKKLTLHFVRCITSMSLQQELELIADFASLPSHKVVSRLELFQTPALKKQAGGGILLLDDLDCCDFELIPENCNEGCGFAPREIIEKLLAVKHSS